MIKSSKTLVAIQSDDYHGIKLTHIDHDEACALHLTIIDGSGAHVFSFADAHELRTFSERMLDQANTMID